MVSPVPRLVVVTRVDTRISPMSVTYVETLRSPTVVHGGSLTPFPGDPCEEILLTSEMVFPLGAWSVVVGGTV